MPAASAAPILIVGSPRSGTSVLTWALGQHPMIMPLEEGDWLCKFAVNLTTTYRLGMSRGERSQFDSMGISSRDFHSSIGSAVSRLLLDHRFEYERLRAERGTEAEQADDAFRISASPQDPKTRYVDGTPEYSNHILALSWLFPDARFIHVVRDARSVARSLVGFKAVGGSHWDWDDAYVKWMTHVRACLDAELALGSGAVLRVRHRDLVEEPEQALRRCLAFAGEDYAEECLRPLAVTINSSDAGPGSAEEPEGAVRSALIEEAVALSDSVLAERTPRYLPDEGRLAELERKMWTRLAGVERMYADGAHQAHLAEAGSEPAL